MSPAGIEPEKGPAGEVQQQLKSTDLNSHQRVRPTTINWQLSKDNFQKMRKIGRGSQNYAWQQDRLVARQLVVI
jgi:hypothetical protein